MTENTPSIIKEVLKSDGSHSGWMVLCPGCNDGHVFDGRWGFNNNMEKPTFTGSMLVDAQDPARRCHSYVVDGNIQFLSDCFHELKGQTVPLPKF